MRQRPGASQSQTPRGHGALAQQGANCRSLVGVFGTTDPTTCIDSVPQPKVSSASPDANPLLEAALRYAAQGWPVFPCHAPTPDGGCTCGKARCSRPGKHPRPRDGYKAATVNAAAIRKWWTKWPTANVAIATGAGLLVVDIDGPEGNASIAGCELAPTPTVTTGRGRHLYFADPAGKGRCATGLRPGVDVRAAGGYVIAAPSVHPSGASYSWAPGLSPDDLIPPPAPQWLLDELLPRGRIPPDEATDMRDPIPEGRRNITLTSLAGDLHAEGAASDAILAHLLEVNATRCTPPLAEAEVRDLVHGLTTRYPAGANGPQVRVDKRLLRRLAPGPLILYAARQGIKQTTGVAPRQKDLAAVLGRSVRSVKSWATVLRAEGLEKYDQPTRRFVRVPVSLLTDPAVTPEAKVTAIHVVAVSDKERIATVGQAALAKATGKDRATVGRHLQALREQGHLLAHVAPFNAELGRRERCNRYIILDRAGPGAVGLPPQEGQLVRHSEPAGGARGQLVRHESRPWGGAAGQAFAGVVAVNAPLARSVGPFSVSAPDPRSAVVDIAAAADPGPPPELVTEAELVAAAAAQGLTAAYILGMIQRHGLAPVQAILGHGPPPAHQYGAAAVA